MNRVHINPFFPVKNFSTVLDDIFNRGLNDVVGFDNNHTVPAVNIKETDSNFIIELAAPGFEKVDFDIKVENNQLVISAENKSEKDTSEGKWTRKEFHYEKFSRSFTLPETADNEKIDGQYNNGVLVLSISKKEEAKAKPAKLIEIK
ncbi:MAG: Hsp20/alpha crystallin family protein [Saprospiraceae bacterium]|nr:Hsp20/alpha crystallin family protein [Saprospiraceae bacterium]MBK8370695.1 Hsp20/alpha crystallin family protein [Saprospiraceae bacterium]